MLRITGNKLAHRSERCIFIGYVPNSYILWSLRHNRPISACNVVFDDRKSYKGSTYKEKIKCSGAPQNVINATLRGDTNLNSIRSQMLQPCAKNSGTNKNLIGCVRILNHST